MVVPAVEFRLAGDAALIKTQSAVQIRKVAVHLELIADIRRARAVYCTSLLMRNPSKSSGRANLLADEEKTIFYSN